MVDGDGELPAAHGVSIVDRGPLGADGIDETLLARRGRARPGYVTRTSRR